MKRIVQLVATLLLTAAPVGAATLIVDNGTLTGATGVDVGGVLYDVSFLDGTCSGIFSGCDQSSDFAFTTDAAGTTAAEALLAQVFVGIYDAEGGLTRGCTSASCNAFIPTRFVSTGAFGITAYNEAGLDDDSTELSFRGRFETTSNEGAATFARFTLSSVTAAVPEPSTWAMMLMGFGGVGVALRRRRRTNNVFQAA